MKLPFVLCQLHRSSIYTQLIYPRALILRTHTIPIPNPIPATDMSSNLMDTEIGGEQTQYEAEYTDVQPRAKEAGQLGGMRSPMPQRHALSHSKTVPN
jgi:hypothetical protein